MAYRRVARAGGLACRQCQSTMVAQQDDPPDLDDFVGYGTDKWNWSQPNGPVPPQSVQYREFHIIEEELMNGHPQPKREYDVQEITRQIPPPPPDPPKPLQIKVYL